jgi:hypothetical protein
MKIETTFEEYLRSQYSKAIDFHIRAEVNEQGVEFYIHPQDVNGDTLDYRVNGNTLECVTETLD